MHIRFSMSKQVRTIDTEFLPDDVLELILRRGITEMAKDPSTKSLIQSHSHRQKPEPKAMKTQVVKIG